MTRWIALFTLALVAGPGGAAEPFFFQPKDRIVFLGDSITEQYQYSSYVELYLTTRYPQGEMLFLNAGIGGDTANGGAGRFQEHVLSDKPTKVTINFGMNDAGYGNFNPATNKVFVEKTDAMLDAAKKAGVQVALVSPNAVDRRINPNFKNYVETQKQFYAPLAASAKKFGFPYADQYTVTRAAVEAMEKDDPKAAKAKPYGDGFHTSPPGGLLMAHAILTQLHAPADVSTAEVNAKTGVAKGTAAKISGVEPNPHGVSFARLDDALPLPVQKDWLSMLPYTNNLDDLNRYMLTVTDLPEGDYSVRIDGCEVTSTTAAALATGINLGNLTAGPLYDQGNKVLQAINAKNAIVKNRFFGVTRMALPDWLRVAGEPLKQEERAKRLAQIETAQADVYKLAQPTAHKFEIVKK